MLLPTYIPVSKQSNKFEKENLFSKAARNKPLKTYHSVVLRNSTKMLGEMSVAMKLIRLLAFLIASTVSKIIYKVEGMQMISAVTIRTKYLMRFKVDVSTLIVAY